MKIEDFDLSELPPEVRDFVEKAKASGAVVEIEAVPPPSEEPAEAPEKKRQRHKHPALSPTLSPEALAVEEWRRALRFAAQQGAVPTFSSPAAAEEWALDFAGALPEGFRPRARREAVERTDLRGKSSTGVEWVFSAERAK